MDGGRADDLARASSQLLDANPGRWDLSRMKGMLVGGSAAPRAMIAGFKQRHGLNVVHGWGMTETSPVASTAELPGDARASADEETQFDYIAMQGIPLPFVELRARDVDGDEIPWDGEAMGELEIARPVGRRGATTTRRSRRIAGPTTAGSRPATSSRCTRAASSRSRTARRT